MHELSVDGHVHQPQNGDNHWVNLQGQKVPINCQQMRAEITLFLCPWALPMISHHSTITASVLGLTDACPGAERLPRSAPGQLLQSCLGPLLPGELMVLGVLHPGIDETVALWQRVPDPQPIAALVAGGWAAARLHRLPAQERDAQTTCERLSDPARRYRCLPPRHRKALQHSRHPRDAPPHGLGWAATGNLNPL